MTTNYEPIEIAILKRLKNDLKENIRKTSGIMKESSEFHDALEASSNPSSLFNWAENRLQAVKKAQEALYEEDKLPKFIEAITEEANCESDEVVIALILLTYEGLVEKTHLDLNQPPNNLSYEISKEGLLALRNIS